MQAEAMPLGGWENDRGNLVVAPRPVLGDFSELDPISRFRIYLPRILCQRERHPNAEFDQPAGFVLVDMARHRALKATRAVDRTFSSGLKTLTGRIHFVTESMTTSVYETFSGTDDEPIFKCLEKEGLEEAPLVIYLPLKGGSVLHFFPAGCASDVGREQLRLTNPVVNAEDVIATVRAVYLSHLVTPDMADPFPIWEDASKGWPKSHAEKGIQQHVRAGLAGRFHHCRPDMEQPGKDGRTDVELVEDRADPPGAVVRHALLELKVLRSRGSTGAKVSESDTARHILDGVEQAHAYSVSRSTAHKFLCCFDMRDGDVGDDVTFASVKAHADALGVPRYRWYLYRSSEAYRAALASEVAKRSAPAASASPLVAAGAAAALPDATGTSHRPSSVPTASPAAQAPSSSGNRSV